MNESLRHLPVLAYLQRQLDGSLSANDITHMRYPTAISTLLAFRIVEIGKAMAVLEVDVDPLRHGNQRMHQYRSSYCLSRFIGGHSSIEVSLS